MNRANLAGGIRAALAVGILVSAASPLSAQVTWDAGGGADKSWGNTANWSGNAVPTPIDVVDFNDTGASSVPGTPTSVLDLSRTIGGLSIANTGGHFQTIDLGTNTLKINGNVDVNTNVVDTTLATIQDGTLNLGGASTAINLSVGRVTLNTNAQAFATLDLTGATVNANLNNLIVGEKTQGGSGFATGSLSLGPSGTFSVGSVAAPGEILIGHASNGAGAAGTVDLSRQTTFTANVSNLFLGTAEVGMATGTLSLAASNTINATTIRVGYSTQNDNQSSISTLHLGAANTISTGALTVGGQRSDGMLDMPIGGNLTLGTNALPTNLTVGETDAATAANAQATMQLTGGTFNATLSNLSVGVKTGGGVGNTNGNETGTLSGGNAGALVVGSPSALGNIVIGQVAAGNGTASGTVDFSGQTSFTANVNNLLLGSAAGGNAAGTLSLAANNTINAASIVVGNATQADNEQFTNALHLGAANIISTGTFTVGGQRSDGLVDIPVAGSLTLGSNALPTNLTVGETDATTATSAQSTMKLAGATFNATLNNLSVGIKTGGGSATETGTLTGGGAGSVVIGSTAALGNVAIGQISGGGSASGTVDFSGENSLTANVANVLVGSANGGTATGTLSLAGTNTINATTIRVGYSTVNDNTPAGSALHLGANNTINTSELTIGGRQSSGSLDIPAGGTFTLGSSGTPTSLSVAETDAQTNQSQTGTVKLTGATFNATLSSLSVGVKTGGGSATETGTLTGGNAGNIVVGSPTALGTVTIGQSSAGGSGTGTVDLSGQTSFTANLSQAIIGQSGNGFLKLAATNTIDTQTLIVGDNGAGTLTFGNHNSLLVDNMQVGNSYANAGVSIPAGGAITIGSPNRLANLSIGKVVINTNSTFGATVDLSNANVNAWFGNLTVGSRDTSLPGTQLAHFVGGNSGTITVGTTGNTANMIVGAGATSTVDFSGMDAFNANLSQMSLGAGGSASVALAKTTNIDASSIVVANNGTATLTLGQNNTILADSLQAGLNVGNGSILLPVGGVLNLGSQARPTNLVLGNGIENTGNTYTGTLDLSGGTVHAYLGSVTLGQKDTQPGQQSGVLSISNHAANTIVANSIVMGTGNASGTINYGGGDFTATSIARGVGGTATFNWQGGRCTSARSARRRCISIWRTPGPARSRLPTPPAAFQAPRKFSAITRSKVPPRCRSTWAER